MRNQLSRSSSRAINKNPICDTYCNNTNPNINSPCNKNIVNYLNPTKIDTPIIATTITDIGKFSQSIEFIRKPTEIVDTESKKLENRDYKLIKWLTISQTQTTFTNVKTICKIQVTSRSTLFSFNSTFKALQERNVESAIEIFANSNAVFENCVFESAQKAAVMVRDLSSAEFINCTFIGNKVSVFTLDDSYVKFVNCHFLNDTSFSIFVTKNSSALIEKSTFNNILGKGILAQNNSKIYIKHSKFNNCLKGAMTVANSNELFLEFVEITNSSNTAIRVVNNSLIKAKNVTIKKTKGNSVNIENSHGYIYDSLLIDAEYPSVAVFGFEADPIFYNCKVFNSDFSSDLNKSKEDDIVVINKETNYAISCRNGCVPIFESCYFSGFTNNFFSISDFSAPLIKNCTFENYQTNTLLFSIFNGANPTITTSNKYVHNSYPAQFNVKMCSKINESESKVVKKLGFVKEESINNDPQFEAAQSHQFTKKWIPESYIKVPELEHFEDPIILVESKFKNENQNETKYNVLLNPIIKPNMPMLLNKYNQKHHNHHHNCECEMKCENICNHVPKCSVCQKRIQNEEDNYVFSPCGHSVCRECKEAGKQTTKCTICNGMIQQISKVFHEETCVICMEKRADSINLPCGHLCTCFECANRMSAENLPCPLCNEKMSNKFVFD